MPAHKIHRALQYFAAESKLRMPVKARDSEHVEVVVCLTTFPARINSVWKTLETLYRQSVTAREIVLILSSDEFTDRCLPASIGRYVKMGLRVKFVSGNIRSYKKLVPALEDYPDTPIVTADDDVLYPYHWLKHLVSEHHKRPDYILGHRGTEILTNGAKALPYVEWPPATTETSTGKIFLTGMGGILYPPRALPPQCMDMTLAFELCPTADDIWFKAMALLAGTPSARIIHGRSDFVTVREAQSISLRKLNVSQQANDIQFSKVISYFDLWNAIY